MPGIWQRILDLFSGGPEVGDQLDQVAGQMVREVGLHKDIAAQSVAMSRTKQRELAQAVADHQTLEQAAVQLQQQGKTDLVQVLAVRLSESKKTIEILTGELEQLNTGASESVEKFRQERDEAKKLLSQHGRLKAVAQMNTDLDRLRQEMRAIAGASTAKGAYQALASQIEVKTQQFRAMAELESGDAVEKARVNQALKEIEVQGILSDIQAKALSVGTSPIVALPTIDRAIAALANDPIRGMLPASTGGSSNEETEYSNPDKTEET